jgi:CHASE2 domain-containing sensor protein/signal transduction histidine kinase
MSRLLHDERLRAALILAAVALLATLTGIFSRVDNLLYDLGQRLHATPAPAQIVIVAIDEESLSQLGRWPWSRRIHATLIDKLREGGARVIGLDIIFAEPDTADPPADAELVDAVRNAGNVVLPVMLEHTRHNGPILEVLPIPELTRVAAGLGRVHAELSEDGIARGIYLWEGVGEPRWPHYAEAVLDAARLPFPGRVAQPVKSNDPNPFTLVRHSPRRVPFLGPPGQVNSMPYVQVLTGRFPKGLFKDKIVLVGATASGLGDRLPTPVSGLTEPMPGVEFHANTIAAMEAGKLIVESPRWITLVLTAVIALLPVPLLARVSPRNGLIASLGLILLVILFSLVAPSNFQIWFPPSGSLLALLIAYPVWSWRRLESATRYLDREIRQLSHELQRSSISLAPAHTAKGADPFALRIQQIQNASRRVHALRSLIDQVIESMPHGVVALDQTGKVRLANRHAQDWLSVEKELPAPDEIRFSGDGKAEQQREVQGRDGQPLLVETAPMNSMDLKQVVSLVDITPVKQLERERRETLSFLSHDIRAPLALAVAEIGNGSPSAQTLDRLRGQLSRALELAEEFLQTARAEIADSRNFQELDLAALLQQAVDSVHDFARTRQVKLVRQVPDEPMWVRGDFGLLERVAFNLVQNAVKYSRPDSEVQVNLSGQQGSARLEVRDHGPGVAADQLPLLFRRFSRLEGNSESGAGLGLHFVQTTAIKHGGKVWVESEIGEGTRFYFEVPLA